MIDSELIDFEVIFRQAPVGMCVSQNRVIRACNDSLAAIFGYRAQDLVGQSFRVLYPTIDEFERTGARIVPAMNATGHYSDERIMKRANEELFWCHVSGRGLIPDDPHAAGIWAFEDLSARRPVTAVLTAREREIAALLVEGKTSKLIGRQIGLSPRTVEMHRARLMKKFGAATSSELVTRLLLGAATAT
ncbi:MAG TPA: PAS and helix-turn-helix domain-containing protein [Noviherbaspirillum sp.]